MKYRSPNSPPWEFSPTCTGNYSCCAIKGTGNEFRIIQEPPGGSIYSAGKFENTRAKFKSRSPFHNDRFKSWRYTRSRRNYRDLIWWSIRQWTEKLDRVNSLEEKGEKKNKTKKRKCKDIYVKCIRFGEWYANKLSLSKASHSPSVPL
jgi:hypothetical protein